MMALVLVGSLPACFLIVSTCHSVGEAGEVVAGSAVAGEAEQDVVGSEDAPVLEDDGFGPPPK